MFYAIQIVNDVIGFIAFFITAITAAGLLSYFSNVSLSKTCLLLHLYKDFVTILVSLRFVWMIKVILSYMNVETEDKLQSKIVVFCLFSGLIALLLVMNLISGLKLVIAKRMELDPSLPWIGDDDSTGINKIRFICALFIAGLMSILYSIGLYPKMYYGFAGIENDSHPVATILYREILGTLILSCTTTWMATKHYEKEASQQLETLIPRTINYFLWISFFIVGFMLIGETIEVLDFRTRWNLYQLMFTAGEITISMAIILKCDKLKDHFKKFIMNMIDYAFLYNIIIVPTLISGFMYGSIFAIHRVVNI